MKSRSTRYMMNVVTWLHNLYIDATFFGNKARFINHSCDPNCVVKMCIKAGLPSACIYSKNRISKGTPLTFDYFTNELELLATHLDGPCRCGSVKCRYSDNCNK